MRQDQVPQLVHDPGGEHWFFHAHRRQTPLSENGGPQKAALFGEFDACGELKRVDDSDVVKKRARQQEVLVDLRIQIGHRAADSRNSDGVLEQTPDVCVMTDPRSRTGPEPGHEAPVTEHRCDEREEASVANRSCVLAKLPHHLTRVPRARRQQLAGFIPQCRLQRVDRDAPYAPILRDRTPDVNHRAAGDRLGLTAGTEHDAADPPAPVTELQRQVRLTVARGAHLLGAEGECRVDALPDAHRTRILSSHPDTSRMPLQHLDTA